MPFRIIWTSILLAALATLAACSQFQSYVEHFERRLAADKVAIPSAAPGYLTEEIPPCTPVANSPVDPCEPGWEPPGATGESTEVDFDEPYSVQFFLEGARDHVPHIVIRGTYLPGTVRCESTVFRPRAYHSPDAYRFSRGKSILYCYADVRVNAYILGSGPPTLTVKVAHDFVDPKWTEEEREAHKERWENNLSIGREDLYTYFNPSPIVGTEVVLFIGPAVGIAVEVWEVFMTWNVERRDDGTVIAAHPFREAYSLEEHRDAVEIELPNFKQAVAMAQEARVRANNGRALPDPATPKLITDVYDLPMFFTEAGAYNHPDGPPVQPPMAYACDNDTAVTSPTSNRLLVHDCGALLALKDSLVGTSILNWSADLAIGSWTGVTTAGAPQRVTEVSLPSSSLNGSIPDGLGDLSALTTLDLSNNQLAGAIPASLGELSGLSTLRLLGNSLSGCIPAALRNVPVNDLVSVGLEACYTPATGKSSP